MTPKAVVLGCLMVVLGCSEPPVSPVDAAKAPPAASVPVAIEKDVSLPLVRAVFDSKVGTIGLTDAEGGVLGDIGFTVLSSGGQTHREAARVSPRNRRLGAWRETSLGEGGWRAVAVASTPTATWEVSVSQAAPSAPIDIRGKVLFSSRTIVGQQALVLRFTGLQGSTMLSRAYREVPAASGLIADAWTPQRIGMSLGSGRLDLSARAQAMRIQEKPGDDFRVVLEADHHANHPFRPFKDCLKTYDAGARSERRKRDPITVQAGDVREVSARLDFDAPMRVVPLRYPRGQRAALVFTDHADQSTHAQLRALMYGASVGTQGGGFVGHGLGMTKTVFVQGLSGGPIQLGDPDYAMTLKGLIGRGIEVGPHSVGEGAERSELTSELLPRFKEVLGAPVWIDHQPMTNCEALSNQGAVAGSRYYLVDQLKAHGYRYVWAGTDVKASKHGLNMFEPSRPRGRPAILYTHSAIDAQGAEPLQVFSSVWQYYDTARFISQFDATRLDQLSEERGLHIAHTYLDAMSSGEAHRGKSLLEERDGIVHLKPRVEAWLSALGARQIAGDLWVAGVVAVADHMTGMRQVRVDPASSGTRLRSRYAIAGASFLMPGKAVQVRIDGKPVPADRLKQEADGTSFWLDMAAGVDYLVTATSSAE